MERKLREEELVRQGNWIAKQTRLMNQGKIDQQMAIARALATKERLTKVRDAMPKHLKGFKVHSRDYFGRFWYSDVVAGYVTFDVYQELPNALEKAEGFMAACPYGLAPDSWRRFGKIFGIVDATR